MKAIGLSQTEAFPAKDSPLAAAHADSFLSAVIRAIPDILLVVDAAGNYRLVSESVEARLGLTTADLLGKNVADVFPSEFAQFALDMIQKTLRDNISLSFEHVLRMTKSELWFRSVTSPFEFEGDACVVWIARDITDDKFSARTLQLVSSITHEIGRAENVSDAVNAALDIICTGLGWPIGEAWLVDREGQKLTRSTFRLSTEAEHFRRCAESRSDLVQQMGRGLTGRAWATGKLQYAVEFSGDDRLNASAAENLSRYGIIGACAIPLLSQDRVLGILTFLLDDPTDEEGRLIAALAGAMVPLGTLLHRLDVERERQSLLERLDLTLSGGNIGAWEWTASKDEMILDDQMLRIYQLPESRRVMTMEEWFGFVEDEAGAARLLQFLQKSPEQNDFVDETVAIRDGAGNPKIIIIRGRVIRTSTGDIERIVGVNLDATEVEKTKRDLSKYARFHEESPGPIFRINVEGTFVDTNNSASLMLRALGHKVGDIRSQWIRIALRCLSDRKKRKERVTAGSQTFQLEFVPVVEHDYVNIYGTDISREQQVEEKLQEAQKMETVGRMTGGVAHNFNNRLTAIIGNLQILQRKCAGDDAVQRTIGTALKSAKAGADLVQRLMKISKQDFMKAEPVELNALMQSTLHSRADLIPAHIHLLSNFSPDESWVSLDPSMFVEALIILIENAVQAMPESGKLTISTARVNLDPEFAQAHDLGITDCIRVSVEDTGIGMDKFTLKNIFEPFFTTKEPGQGVGLGLCVVQGMVERLRGTIDVKSQRGGGSSISLYLPRYHNERL